MVGQVLERLELVPGHLLDPLLVLLGGAEQGGLADQLTREQAHHDLDPCRVERRMAGAVLLDGPLDDACAVGDVVLRDEHGAGQVRRAEVGGHCGERQRRHMSRPGVVHPRRGVLLQVPGQHVLAVLCLQDRTADRAALATRLLVPPTALRRDVAALDLEHSPPHPRPGDQQVELLLPTALDQRDGVEQHRLGRQLIAQRLPDDPLRAALLGEVRLGGVAAGHAGCSRR